MREHKIHDHLIINMDETGLKIVCVDKYTLERLEEACRWQSLVYA